ncbi:hypothetical protein ACUXAV_002856 [Cupriavidus metallidurans]|nr:hypothetical protein [Cupriavidus metallidurans]MDE4919808.1 hypothetical protein [Cupriavidus metallidurans]UBM11684.1 hypothetical protein LAI70_15185 [Cupriavidus metallidurans]
MVPAEFYEPMSAGEFLAWVAVLVFGLWCCDRALCFLVALLDEMER